MSAVLLLFLGLSSYAWNLPPGVAPPRVPIDNPMTVEKVELGRYLFYDKRLSVNGLSSCATCHQQDRAFTDGLAFAVGTTGEKHPRGAMTLVNVGYSKVLTWGNPTMTELGQQVLVPMYGTHPVELGLRSGDDFLARIASDTSYQKRFAAAFPTEEEPITLSNVTKALASFERSIVSFRSPYDRYHFGRDDAAVSEAAKRGEILFFSQPLSCFRCHGGVNFSSDDEFHNTGLYGAAQQADTGVAEFTKDPKDAGKFKAPTLRNIALTAPYMHDGSVATLGAVLDHYAAGGRAGHDHVLKDPLISGFNLSARDREDLVEFLKSLTDDEVIRDPRFSDPNGSSGVRP